MLRILFIVFLGISAFTVKAEPTKGLVAVTPESEACRYKSGAPTALKLIDRAKFWSKIEELINSGEVFEYNYSEPKTDGSGKKVVLEKRERISFNLGGLKTIFKGEKKCTIEGILDYWELSGGGHPKVLALLLSTALKETNYTLKTEYSEKLPSTNLPAYAKPDKFGRAYYGRGLTQLTKIANYTTFDNRLGIPLIEQPELAATRENSIRILVDGARLSLFNTVYGKVETYLNDSKSDWVRARGLVNPGSYRKRTVGYLACRLYDAIQPAYLKPAPVQDPKLCKLLAGQTESAPL